MRTSARRGGSLALLLSAACVMLALAACSPAGGPQTGECTPTKPNGNTPPGERPSEYYFGNGRLWTTLWPGGDVAFEAGGPGEIREDGSLAMKFPFWRGEGVIGALEITGRSLHRTGLAVVAEIPEGYGEEGFQATALVFPEPGCYEITARVGEESLTFVTRVSRRE